MSRIFISELNKDMRIWMAMFNGVESEYTILDIYVDGIKVLKEVNTLVDDRYVIKNHIVLVPYNSIKYIRMIGNEV